MTFSSYLHNVVDEIIHIKLQICLRKNYFLPVVLIYFTKVIIYSMKMLK